MLLLDVALRIRQTSIDAAEAVGSHEESHTEFSASPRPASHTNHVASRTLPPSPSFPHAGPVGNGYNPLLPHPHFPPPCPTMTGARMDELSSTDEARRCLSPPRSRVQQGADGGTAREVVPFPPSAPAAGEAVGHQQERRLGGSIAGAGFPPSDIAPAMSPGQAARHTVTCGFGSTGRCLRSPRCRQCAPREGWRAAGSGGNQLTVNTDTATAAGSGAGNGSNGSSGSTAASHHCSLLHHALALSLSPAAAQTGRCRPWDRRAGRGSSMAARHLSRASVCGASRFPCGLLQGPTLPLLLAFLFLCLAHRTALASTPDSPPSSSSSFTPPTGQPCGSSLVCLHGSSCEKNSTGGEYCNCQPPLSALEPHFYV